VAQAIAIFALHVSETEIDANVEIEITSAVEPALTVESVVVGGKGVSKWYAGCSLYMKVMTSRGRQHIGNC
jgi:hypothetical protein